MEVSIKPEGQQKETTANPAGDGVSKNGNPERAHIGRKDPSAAQKLARKKRMKAAHRRRLKASHTKG